MRTQFTEADRTLLIPSVGLAGTREAKLQQIDRVLAQLNAIRRTLAGGAPRPSGTGESDGAALAWWAAGVLVAMLFVLSAAGAWATASGDGPSTRPVAVVHESY